MDLDLVTDALEALGVLLIVAAVAVGAYVLAGLAAGLAAGGAASLAASWALQGAPLPGRRGGSK